MKQLLVSLILLSLSGCDSIFYAGNAGYNVKPFEDSKGAIHCCEVNVHNGKEIANLKFHMHMGKDGEIVVDLEEQGVAAFEGQRIASVVAQDSIKAATTAAMITGGVLIAPVAAGTIGAIAASGTIPAAVVGGVAAGATGAAVDKGIVP